MFYGFLLVFIYLALWAIYEKIECLNVKTKRTEVYMRDGTGATFENYLQGGTFYRKLDRNKCNIMYINKKEPNQCIVRYDGVDRLAFMIICDGIETIIMAEDERY